MSITLMTEVYKLAVDQDMRDILMALADHADDDGNGVRPSIARLAWKTGDGIKNAQGEYKNQRTVQRRIKQLLTLKALALIRKASQHRANEYHLDLSVFPRKPDFEPTGDNFRGDKLTPPNISGVTKSSSGVTKSSSGVTKSSSGVTKSSSGVTDMVSPEPSNESSIEPSINTARGAVPDAPENFDDDLPEWWGVDYRPPSEEKPIVENVPPAPKKEAAVNCTSKGQLDPASAEEIYLFKKLNVERRARGLGAQKRFKTLAQRDRFSKCVAHYNGHTLEEIDRQFELGKNTLDAVINGINWRREHTARGVVSVSTAQQPELSYEERMAQKRAAALTAQMELRKQNAAI